MLCIAKSTLSHNWASLPTGSSRRSQVYGINPNSHLPTSKHNHRIQFLGYQKMNIFTTTLEVLHYGKNRKMDMAVYSSGIEPGLPFPLPFNLPFDLNPDLGEQTWVLGLVLALTPFGISTWWPILKSKAFELGVWKTVDSIMQTTETVAETVEKVADKVDKVAEDLADILPEGKLKQAARYIEDIAEEAEKDAHLVDEAIEKLEEIEIGLKEEAERFVQTNAKSKEAENS
ncbi:plastid-targeted protein [Salix suchowensis]|nr:plastid-targeted protein [Salix suchowensis]